MAYAYIVPGQRRVYAQPTGNTCWSAAFAMVKSWNSGARFHNPREAVVPMGTPWLGYYDTDTPIPPAQGDAFVAATGLVREPRFNPSVAGWHRLLVSYGLLWVSSVVPAGLHDRVLAGINGDGTPGGTVVYIMDPDGGRQYEQNYGEFSAQFEQQAGVAPFYSDYQILHYAPS
ncbi:MAG: papain-like cysteine protease family protein [Rhodospirillales bacterium]